MYNCIGGEDLENDIYYKLMALTREELDILDGANVNQSLYTDNADFIIDSNKLLTKNKLIDIRKHTRFVHFPKHKHNYIELIYVYKGTFRHIINTQKLELKSGELIFLNQQISHEVLPSEYRDIAINFIIRPEFFNYILTFLDNDNIICDFLFTTLYTNNAKAEYLYFKVSENAEIQETIKKIMIELYKPSTMSEATIKLLVGLLLVELANSSDSIESYSVNDYEKKLVVKTLNYIDTNYRTATLYEISEKLSQPHYKLSRTIKKYTGLTFNELLQEKRLSKAQELLKSTNLPISTIVQSIGYENQTYFYKIFKEKYDNTPKQYRDKC